ncbi:hypothetical protein [Micromonospora sp. DT47]
MTWPITQSVSAPGASRSGTCQEISWTARPARRSASPVYEKSG